MFHIGNSKIKYEEVYFERLIQIKDGQVFAPKYNIFKQLKPLKQFQSFQSCKPIQSFKLFKQFLDVPFF